MMWISQFRDIGMEGDEAMSQGICIRRGRRNHAPHSDNVVVLTLSV